MRGNLSKSTFTGKCFASAETETALIGYTEALEGVEFDPDRYSNECMQRNYEMGRLIALNCKATGRRPVPLEVILRTPDPDTVFMALAVASQQLIGPAHPSGGNLELRRSMLEYFGVKEMHDASN